MVEKWIGDLFARYGRFVARHPVKIIILAIVINGGLAIGMIKLTQITDIDVYMPTGMLFWFKWRFNSSSILVRHIFKMAATK